MFKKLLTNNFNKKYAGKELFFCPRIFEDIIFYPNIVLKCCHHQIINKYPPIVSNEPNKKLSFYKYLKAIDKTMELNQTNTPECGNCRFLKKQIVPEFKHEKFLTFFTINHFTKCNSNCVYCGIGRKTEDIKYHLLPVIKQMVKDKMFDENCLINWGGGEPTMCSEFEEIASFFHKNNIRQAINSSGIIFSNTILEGLKDGSMSIQISPDAGTEETYKKIKRQNNFHKVWENIKQYAQYPDMLFVKYIFFSYSANEIDVREFIRKCKECGVKHIVIDCESRSATAQIKPFGEITDEIVNLAILMKKLAIENNIKYEISYQWKDEHHNTIENA